MEGLEASVVSSTLLNDDFRFDAQFFLKAYLEEDQSLHKHELRNIGDFAFVTDGPHGYHVVDESSPIAMLTARSAGGWFAEREGADTIAKWVDEANKRSSLALDDLILSTRGTVGNCAIVTEEALPANIDQDVARIAINTSSGFEPNYVLAYLNCKFGQDHITRNTSGMVQQGMSLAKVRAIPVPLLSAGIQSVISELITSALSKRREGRKTLETAQDTIAHELGLDGWQPPTPLVYTAPASQAFKSGRLDAQYFRPLFVEIEERLRATNVAVELGSLLSTNARGNQPTYSDGGLPVINSKHVRMNRVIVNNSRTAMETASKIQIRKGDVLLNGTGVGTIGRAAAYLHEQAAIPDNHVTVLRTDQVDPIYLAVFLNSPLGQWQIERHIKGSSGQIELYPSDIAKILIWIAPIEVQTSVSKAVLAAFHIERETREILAGVKHAVEIAVERGETPAMHILDQLRASF